MRKKILVIDDAPITRMLLKKQLQDEYDVECKGDGNEALEWLEGNLPHLIICDIQMPNLDGYDFLKAVRRRGYTEHTPVIMLSGEENGKDRVKCYVNGAQDFLAKPYNSDELMCLIKKNLEPIHYALKW